MDTILIVNPKGGSGKTTLVTNLAGYLARQGEMVNLIDTDKQKSSIAWLKHRSPHLPTIFSTHTHNFANFSVKPSWSIIDTPAGLNEEILKKLLKKVDLVIVPIQPSFFDFQATQSFLEILNTKKPIRKGQTSVALVGMRVHPRTITAQQLEDFLKRQGFPIFTYIHDAQIYLQMASKGFTLFDLSPAKAKTHIEQWQPITEWIQNAHKI